MVQNKGIVTLETFGSLKTTMALVMAPLSIQFFNVSTLTKRNYADYEIEFLTVL